MRARERQRIDLRPVAHHQCERPHIWQRRGFLGFRRRRGVYVGASVALFVGRLLLLVICRLPLDALLTVRAFRLALGIVNEPRARIPITAAGQEGETGISASWLVRVVMMITHSHAATDAATMRLSNAHGWASRHARGAIRRLHAIRTKRIGSMRPRNGW